MRGYCGYGVDDTEPIDGIPTEFDNEHVVTSQINPAKIVCEDGKIRVVKN